MLSNHHQSVLSKSLTPNGNSTSRQNDVDLGLARVSKGYHITIYSILDLVSTNHLTPFFYISYEVKIKKTFSSFFLSYELSRKFGVRWLVGSKSWLLQSFVHYPLVTLTNPKHPIDIEKKGVSDKE